MSIIFHNDSDTHSHFLFLDARRGCLAASRLPEGGCATGRACRRSLPALVIGPVSSLTLASAAVHLERGNGTRTRTNTHVVKRLRSSRVKVLCSHECKRA